MIPEQLSHLPTLDGLPLPAHTAFSVDAPPAFSRADLPGLIIFTRTNRCSVCAVHLDVPFGFSTLDAASRDNFRRRATDDAGWRIVERAIIPEGAIHPRCAAFSLQNCPFLISPQYQFQTERFNEDPRVGRSRDPMLLVKGGALQLTFDNTPTPALDRDVLAAEVPSPHILAQLAIVPPPSEADRVARWLARASTEQTAAALSGAGLDASTLESWIAGQAPLRRYAWET